MIRNQIVVLTISLSCILILIAAGVHFLVANVPSSTNGSTCVKITPVTDFVEELKRKMEEKNVTLLQLYPTKRNLVHMVGITLSNQCDATRTSTSFFVTVE